jgi:hypothetical protein
MTSIKFRLSISMQRLLILGFEICSTIVFSYKMNAYKSFVHHFFLTSSLDRQNHMGMEMFTLFFILVVCLSSGMFIDWSWGYCALEEKKNVVINLWWSYLIIYSFLGRMLGGSGFSFSRIQMDCSSMSVLPSVLYCDLECYICGPTA